MKDKNASFPETNGPRETDFNEIIFDEVSEIAKKTFGIKFLYPWQRLVIANILDAVQDPEENEFCHQIVLLPTGAGKSMCFLVPAVILKKPTLIIYPLLALMADQQRRMQEAGLKSVVLRGGQSVQERENILEQIKQGVNIILANPEVLQNKTLVQQLAECGIQHIAIDEAHCVYEWGSSFRSSYLTLGNIAEQLHSPVVTAFTATASPEVLQQISKILFKGNAHIVQSASDRPNIHYHVINCYNKKKQALKLAVKSEKPVLLFCGTRKKAEDMARELREYYKDDSVKFYHAGLTKEEKTAVENWFYPKENAYLCATVAFGMGIDKKNIRTVIHVEPSSSIEAYIQEAGRAGRDGKVSNAYLLWNPDDKVRTLKNERTKLIARYAESKTCRRQFLLDALGGENAVCSGCDICDTGKPAPFAQDAQTALHFIKKYRRLYDKNQISSALIKEFNRQDCKNFNICIWEHRDMEIIMNLLEKNEFIKTMKFPWKGKIDITKKSF
ncbi:MAG: RecQ family ATP-dependent DNA helicase [Treponema sp.]|nr:RecQ family ATP-dependent DNA helicase [Treponema sp.]